MPFPSHGAAKMAARPSRSPTSDVDRRENIAYIRQLVGELRQIAGREHADLLCYFLEMAYMEAGDLMAGKQTMSQRRVSGKHGQ